MLIIDKTRRAAGLVAIDRKSQPHIQAGNDVVAEHGNRDQQIADCVILNLAGWPTNLSQTP
jgi:hypothetical protein